MNGYRGIRRRFYRLNPDVITPIPNEIKCVKSEMYTATSAEINKTVIKITNYNDIEPDFNRLFYIDIVQNKHVSEVLDITERGRRF